MLGSLGGGASSPSASSSSKMSSSSSSSSPICLIIIKDHMSIVTIKPVFGGVATRVDSNQPAELQMLRLIFAYGKNRFSHDMAHSHVMRKRTVDTV